ncbi:E-selectin-like isoform X2 [Engraulis encrasicolus]|uniref:E-selectin-like isoform X2 n=1 Tax=Engraulis encrasicolus TaxID=184585 RepID=UPI002FD722EE
MELCFLTTCNQRMSMRLTLTALVFSLMAVFPRVAGWSYHSSVEKMTWDSARAWCRDHYTDMVAIQNQEEIRHLNATMPFVQGYYWIGIRKVNGNWTWVGTNKMLTPEAENWATGEPNGKISKTGKGNMEDCVEIYIQRQTDSAKWNDISCTKKKTALCYTASCDENSCSGHGECVETINNHTCECFKGFYGEKCEKVVQCASEVIVAPPNGSVSCFHPHGDFSFASECSYSCQTGYQLSSFPNLTCTHTTAWSSTPPTCQVVECEELARPDKGFMSCSVPLGSAFSYTSVCQFACEEGYVLSEPLAAALTCGAQGWWNGTQPHCEAVRCPHMEAPEHGSMSCDGAPSAPNSYPAQCTFTCEHGYRLTGTSAISCTASGQWTDQRPSCEAITCPRPESPHLLSNCSTSLQLQRVGATCAFSCSTGFVLRGERDKVQCGETGQWSSQTPTCEVVKCAPLQAPASGNVTCNGLSRGAVCHISCNEGFALQGARKAQCENSAEWRLDGEAPTCSAIQCPAMEAPQYGHVSCDHDSSVSSSWPNQCSFSCEEGFSLVGASTVNCTTGHWTHQTPKCEAIQCPAMEAPQYGHVSCDHDSSVSSSWPNQCSFSCEEGFSLVGASTVNCTTGHWTHQTPTCEAVKCPVIQTSSDSLMNCSRGVDGQEGTYATHCTFSCQQGLLLHGNHTMTCSRHGNWTGDIPECQAPPEPLVNPSTIMMAAGGATSLSALSLIFWLLRRMQQKGNKFDLNSTLDKEEPPQFYRNSTDCLI